MQVCGGQLQTSGTLFYPSPSGEIFKCSLIWSFLTFKTYFIIVNVCIILCMYVCVCICECPRAQRVQKRAPDLLVWRGTGSSELPTWLWGLNSVRAVSALDPYTIPHSLKASCFCLFVCLFCFSYHLPLEHLALRLLFPPLFFPFSLLLHAVTGQGNVEVPLSCILAVTIPGLFSLWLPWWWIPWKIMKLYSRNPRPGCSS